MNLGWQITSKKHTAEWLCTAVEDVIQARALDALGLSEIFEIDDDSEVTTVRKQNFLRMILGRLNSKESAAQPAWKGRWDIHSIFIWKMHLNLVHAELVSCSITDQDWRKAAVSSSRSGVPHSCFSHAQPFQCQTSSDI
jgi:hypothetical protein